MPESDKSSSLVVFVNIQEPNLRLTYASVAVKTLADSVCSRTPSHASVSRNVQCRTAIVGLDDHVKFIRFVELISRV